MHVSASLISADLGGAGCPRVALTLDAIRAKLGAPAIPDERERAASAAARIEDDPWEMPRNPLEPEDEIGRGENERAAAKPRLFRWVGRELRLPTPVVAIASLNKR